MQPELDDQCAFCGQHLFQACCPFQALVEFGCLGAVLHPVDNRPSVPGAKEDADFAFWWQFAPETPHHRAIQLLIRWLAHGVSLDIARVQPFIAVSYTHLRAHETVLDLVCRLLLEKKKK